MIGYIAWHKLHLCCITNVMAVHFHRVIILFYIFVGIPAQNCSFPFTYGGALYYSCVQNVSNSCQCKCLDAGRVWRTVTDFMGKYS